MVGEQTLVDQKAPANCQTSSGVKSPHITAASFFGDNLKSSARRGREQADVPFTMHELISTFPVAVIFLNALRKLPEVKTSKCQLFARDHL